MYCKYIHLFRFRAFIRAAHNVSLCTVLINVSKKEKQRKKEKEASACILTVRWLFHKHVCIHQSTTKITRWRSVPFLLLYQLFHMFSKSPRSLGKTRISRKIWIRAIGEKSREAQAGEKEG